MTINELEKLGYKRNPNLYIGDGYWYCKNCKRYHYHLAFSKNGEHKYICKGCMSES